MLFSKIIDALNDAKETYYLLYNVSENHPDLRKITRREQTRLTKRLNSVAKAIDEDTSEASLLDILTGYVKDVWAAKADGDTLGDLFAAIKDNARASDTPFYSEYGEFWNEVPLPTSIGYLLSAYVNELVTPKTDGMRGYYGVPVDVHKGDWGYSIYDLSDELIIFDSEKHAKKFHEDEGVEPSGFLEIIDVGSQENPNIPVCVTWQCY